jgi:hypothetical protein
MIIQREVETKFQDSGTRANTRAHTLKPQNVCKKQEIQLLLTNRTIMTPPADES